MKVRRLLHCHSRAITFVELMLVLVILATLITVSYPSLRGVHEHNKLKSGARELSSLMRYARAKAIFRGERVALFLDKEKQNYYVVMEETGEGSDHRERESYIDRMHHLPDRVWFAKIDAGNIEGKSSLSYILFFPNSTATEATIVLENNKGNKMVLQVSQATALVTAVRGELKKEAEEKQETEAAEEFYQWRY